MKKLSNILLKTAYVIMIACPFGVGIVYALRYMTGHLVLDRLPEFFWIPELHGKKGAIVFIALILVAIFLLIKLTDRIIAKRHMTDRQQLLFYVILAFIITGLVRIPLVLIFGSDIVPFSDYLYSWQFAHGDFTVINRFRLAATWVNFGLFIKWIINIFGDSYVPVLWSSIVFNAISGAFTVLLCDKVGLKKRVGFLAALLYALSPQGVVHATIGSPEHLAVAFYLISLYFLADALINRNNYRRLAISMLLGGIFAGLGNAYKPISYIIFVAYLIIVILTLMQEDYSGWKDVIRRLVAAVCAMAILIVSNNLVAEGMLRLTENDFGYEMEYNDAVPHFFLVGLVLDGEGQTGRGALSNYYEAKRMQGDTYEEAAEAAFDTLKEQWTSGEYDIPLWLDKKMSWAWQDDTKPVYYILDHSSVVPDTPVESFCYNFIAEYGYAMSQFWYLMLMVFGAAGAIICVFTKKSRDIRFFLPNLITIGFFFLVLLSEGQSRYKYNIMPYFDIMMAFAVCVMWDKWMPTLRGKFSKFGKKSE